MRKFSFWIFGLLSLLISENIRSQQLYIPRNITNAFAKGTRTLDGKPGPKYWQNEGDYNIHYWVTPPDPLLKGEETIIYHNNSHDTLSILAMRFVNNYHKAGAARSFPTNGSEFTPGLKISDFEINGQKIKENATDWSTIGVIHLDKPILPGSTTSLKINWTYKLSVAKGREGIIDSTSFYIAYGYPRISVYDDYNGWDLLEHDDRTEFYNDFNNYHLSITVPDNYLVWATGDLKNSSEVLQKETASRYNQSLNSDSVIRIASRDELLHRRVTKTQPDATNTWIFEANHITDVCVAVSDHFIWEGSSVPRDKLSGKRISLQAAYNDTSTDYHSMVNFERRIMRTFVDSWPGIPYPFTKMTAFQGYADMEYPMMINDESTGRDTLFAHFVSNHEIAHSFFPFYMGTNETRFAFMDEGWATALEYLDGIEQYGKPLADRIFKYFRISHWSQDISEEAQIPIITQTYLLQGRAISYCSYDKPALAYIGLKDLLGDNIFRKSLHLYMERWHGKHPMPWDYFNSINDGAGVNLNWYWKNWFFSHNYIDLKAVSIKERGKNRIFRIENKGGFAIPFDIIIQYKDSTETKIHITPIAWKDHEKVLEIKIAGKKPIQTIKIDGGIFMDATPQDNILNM